MTGISITLIIISFVSYIPVWSENIITIIPGSSKYDPENPFSVTRFFDTSFFPISPNQNITFHNEDKVGHYIFIIDQKRPDIKINSGLIEPKKSFSIILHETGIYNYSSPIYSHMKGYLIVDEKVISKKKDTINNNKEIKISYIGNNSINHNDKNKHFLLTFTDKNTNKNSEHIDYSVLVKNSSEDIIYKQSMHSLWGMELISFKNTDSKPNNNYPLKIKVMINGIFFQPVTQDIVEFNIAN